MKAVNEREVTAPPDSFNEELRLVRKLVNSRSYVYKALISEGKLREVGMTNRDCK